ncbi:hypothetical protein B5M09_006255 [Aphanomyces astaci]|uniref:EF-hand domain-containing protein n=1 Tax=Aphanomyces astaci TaxID=112090 RepID=A0A3R7Y794_APHAT|nr:hypothetical protein B5M09_006255 [Aphanomyces astaci]
MEHCQDIRNELSSCSLQDVIPIHSSVRNVLEKLLQYGDTSKESMVSGGSQLQLNSQPNDNVDNNKPSPQDPENDDDLDDDEEDEFDVSGRAKKKSSVRRKLRKRKGAISPVRAKAARVMPLADVCSAISSLLCEKLWQEANDRSKLTLRPFMRQYFIRVYGLKSLAMAHISSFKHSLAINQHENRRASLFYWFLGCDESRKFSADYAFEFFKSVVKHVLVVHNKAPVKPFLVQTTPDVMTSLESIQYAWTDLLGDGCVLDDVPDNNLNSSTKKRLVTLAKAIEVTKLSFYDGNDREATVSLFLDDLKDRVNPIGMEDFLSGIMDCWLKLFEFTVQLIRVKFKEADKNGDGTMDFEEFIAFMQASNVLGFSERELARTEARMRREAIAIYDSLTNDDNIIDENAFIEYLLTQVQWLSNEEDATVVAAVVAPSPSDASPISPVDHNPSRAPSLSYAAYGAPPAPSYSQQPSSYAWHQPPPPPRASKSDDNLIWYAITSPLQPHTYLLILYFAFNLVFATIAFVSVIVLSSVGVGLVPVCCLGLVVLQGLLYVVHLLAHIDARLYNCTAQAHERIVVSFDVPREGLYHLSGHRISPDLSNFSKESLCAVFYFLFIKFPLSLLSAILASIPLTIAVSLLSYPLYMDDLLGHRGIFAHIPPPNEIILLNQPIDQWRPSQVVVAGAVTLYVAIGLLHALASLARWATKFFTCEFFATSGVVRLYSTLPSYVAAPTQSVSSQWPN